MPAIVTNPVHGPSLDQLDSWGNLDSLLWSLDSSVWPEADIFSLAIKEIAASKEILKASTTKKAKFKAQAATGEWLQGIRVTVIKCSLAATSDQKMHSGYKTARMEAQTASGEYCHAGKLTNAIMIAENDSTEYFNGELRGHGWVERPDHNSVWQDRQL